MHISIFLSILVACALVVYTIYAVKNPGEGDMYFVIAIGIDIVSPVLFMIIWMFPELWQTERVCSRNVCHACKHKSYCKKGIFKYYDSKLKYLIIVKKRFLGYGS